MHSLLDAASRSAYKFGMIYKPANLIETQNSAWTQARAIW